MIFSIFIFVFGNAYCQKPYTKLSYFAGDTLQYQKVNIVDNKARYIGQPLKLLLDDYELSINRIQYNPSETGASIPFKEILFTYAYYPIHLSNSIPFSEIIVTFKEPLYLERFPDFDKYNRQIRDMEIVAYKMKDAVVADIYLRSWGLTEEGKLLRTEIRPNP